MFDEIEGFDKGIVIAVWDRYSGGRIIKSTFDDYIRAEKIIADIFTVLGGIFGDSSEKILRTKVSLPLKKIGMNARVAVDTLPVNIAGVYPGTERGDKDNDFGQFVEGGDGGNIPFITGVLVSETFPTDELDKFDGLLDEIRYTVSRGKEIDLGRFEHRLNEIIEDVTSALFVYENSLNYGITDAVTDFKKGVEKYKRGDFAGAYPLLKRAYYAFSELGDERLMLETLFLTANILYTGKNYPEALEKYRLCADLAGRLGDRKYKIRTLFMTAFLSYKLGYIDSGIEALERIAGSFGDIIDPVKYHYLFARLLIKKKDFMGARSHLSEAVNILDKKIDEIMNTLSGNELSEHKDSENDTERKFRALLSEKAGILYTSAVLNMQIAVNVINTLGFKHKDAFYGYLHHTERDLEKAADAAVAVGDNFTAAHIYKTAGITAMISGDTERAIEAGLLALKYAERTDDLHLKISVLRNIIELMKETGEYGRIIEFIDRFFSFTSGNRFIDIVTLAGLHKLKGDALLSLNRMDEAAGEYLVAYNMLAGAPYITGGIIAIIDGLIYVNRKLGNPDKVQYYSTLRERYIKKIDTTQIRTDIFGAGGGAPAIREFWIIHNTGIIMFNYSPITDLDPDLLGGFMTALTSLGIEMGNRELESISLGGDRYVLYRPDHGQFFIMGRARPDTDEKEVRKMLAYISAKFYGLYKPFIDNFGGDITPFLDFMKKLRSKNKNP